MTATFTAEMTTLDTALELAASGFKVFPVDHPVLERCAGKARGHDPATCSERGKHPAVAFSMAATTDQKMITMWWAGGPRNIGILTGDQWVVLDEDTPGEVERFAAEHGVTIPATMTVGTAKGRHYYFAARPGHQLSTHTGAFGPYNIDVRAGKAYVVGPGSIHATGVVYTVEKAVDPVPLPDWALEALEDRGHPAEAEAVLDADGWVTINTPGDSPRGLAAVPDVIRGPRADSGGQRHQVLVSYASSLRARSVPYLEAEVLFRGVWPRCEQPPVASTPLTWEDARAKLDDVYTRYPAGHSGPPSDLLGTTGTVVDPVSAQVDLADFWASRPVLAHVQQFAYARMVSPLAMLGVLILRVLAVTPPWVVLPPTIGAEGSLNTFVASAGPSGAGKGAVNAAAVGAIDFVEPIYSATVGSGEGLVHQFAHRGKKGEDDIVIDQTSVLFFVSEVDTLAALKGRDGSTLLPQLRSAFSGEQLGFSYADPAKRIPLPAHTYRLTMSVGVQPERAQTLMADADGGTPQRFLWLPATDPDIQEVPPPEPARHVVPQKGWQRGPGGFHTLSVPEVAALTIRQAHVARHRGGGDALDGHALFVRLKVAQALAMLDRRQDMTEDDWDLAGVVMEVSDATRASVVATLNQQVKATDRARGYRDAERAVTTADHVAEHDVKRVANGIIRRVQRQGVEVAWSELRRSAAQRDRPHFEEAVERLVSSGQVEVVADGTGKLVRLVAP